MNIDILCHIRQDERGVVEQAEGSRRDQRYLPFVP